MERLRSLFRWHDAGRPPLLSNAPQRADPVATSAESQNVDLYSTEGSIGIKVIAEPANSNLEYIYLLNPSCKAFLLTRNSKQHRLCPRPHR